MGTLGAAMRGFAFDVGDAKGCVQRKSEQLGGAGVEIYTSAHSAGVRAANPCAHAMSSHALASRHELQAQALTRNLNEKKKVAGTACPNP
jgi:hypothetical protein